MPIQLNDWMIFHCPKTGGSTVHAAAMAGGGVMRGGGHDLVSHWRRELETWPGGVCGTVRDPWTRYGSLYFHALRVGRRCDLERWGNGSSDFRSVLYGWTHSSAVECIPREVGVIWSPGRAASLLDAETGLYSWELACVYGDRVGAYFPTDRLAEAIPALLGVEMTAHRNAAPSSPNYRAMYTDEMVAWVAEADAPVVDRFGFEPWRPTAWASRARV